MEEGSNDPIQLELFRISCPSHFRELRARRHATFETTFAIQNANFTRGDPNPTPCDLVTDSESIASSSTDEPLTLAATSRHDLVMKPPEPDSTHDEPDNFASP